MKPTLFTLAGIEVYSFGFSIFIAFLIGFLVLYLLAKKEDLNPRFIFSNLLIIFFLTLVGGRLLHIILKFGNYLPNLFEIFFIWDGGISMWGIIFSIFALLYYFCLKNNQHLAKWLDIIAISFSLGAAVVFFGQFLGGQGFGKTTDFFLGIYYENISSPYSGVQVHPTSLYMSISSFIIFIISLSLFLFKRPFYSLVYQLTIILFSTAHILTENLRWDVSYFIFGYNGEKMISVIILLIFIFNLSISILNFYGSDFKKKFVIFFDTTFRHRS